MFHVKKTQILFSFKTSLSKLIGFDPSKEKVIYQKLLKKAKTAMKEENELEKKEVVKTVDSDVINGYVNNALDVDIDEDNEEEITE